MVPKPSKAMTPSLTRVLYGRLLLPALVSVLPFVTLPAQHPAANSYRDFYSRLVSVGPLREQTAEVRGLTLKRDAGEFVLEQGRVWLLTPVEGRTVGLAFEGSGIFRFSPSTRMEQERLREIKKVTAMQEPFSELVVFFADSTLEELKSRLTFGPGDGSDRLRDRVREAFTYLGKQDHQSFDPDVMVTLLNGERNDLFYAHMTHRGDPWMFMIDPHEVEGVRLLTRPRGTGFVRYAEVVTQSRRQGFR